jgi:hypothetical protein
VGYGRHRGPTASTSADAHPSLVRLRLRLRSACWVRCSFSMRAKRT